MHLIPRRDGVTDEACGHVAIIDVVEEAEGTGALSTFARVRVSWSNLVGWSNAYRLSIPAMPIPARSET